MKKKLTLILIILASFGLFYCSTPDLNNEPTSQLLVLVIDFESRDFEGGSINNLNQLPAPGPSELPFNLESEAPADGLDGGVSIFYANTDAKVFDGILPIDASVSGNILIPPLLSPSNFFELEDAIPFPSTLIVEDLFGDHSARSFSDLWPSIDQLGIVQNALNNEALVGRYLYQPQPRNEATWKWVIFFFEY